ncbi:hypothetical protein FisN_9Lh260 [Fistulifera solaris]|uniref:B30.2/SPRY domain-containing protein n=1 Tax=Fistulifera solaris TaxID=1519565 RepID=A0A1Z5KL02_FISSO|nr:hypothetical protein FisN_9Lh260 [Fistulifera solaris]|eukprot:GAX26956.1 hypothetical protein FisN_9Lh260 [Fistulifera solaris]
MHHNLLQSLIRFQNQTHVLSTHDPTRIVESIADTTGWPRARLTLTQWSPPFGTVCVVSQIRGGKGGFGTLLKGQARQAGAKATSNFGACRDLQGRRLQHVNQAIEGQLWLEWKRRVEAGTATEEEMAQALLQTDTGIAGWHLQLPAWADVSAKKEQRKWKRAFYQWKKDREAVRQRKEEGKRLQERQVHAYVEAVEQASSQVQSTLERALHEGLREQKRAKMEPDPPSALITLSGDATLAFESNRWRLQSKSNFCTVGVLLQSLPDALYYEIVVLTGGVVQVGWANSAFQPSSESGDGVGDCQNSWGYDGSRQIRLHDEKTAEYGTQPWQANDVVGCLYKAITGTISYFVNGKDLGIAFEVGKGHSLFPVISINPGEIVELRLHKDEMSHNVASSTAIEEVMTQEDTNVEELSDNPDDENFESSLDATTNHNEATQIEKSAKSSLVVEPLNLTDYNSVEDLKELGLDRLKGALMAIGVKCGGTLHERASRLFSLKGLDASDFPKRLLANKKA